VKSTLSIFYTWNVKTGITTNLPAKNQDGVNWTFFHLKIDWNANFKSFWMQNVGYWSEEYFEPFPFRPENQRLRQNPKLLPKAKNIIFADRFVSEI
jgi:hypothetical protein